MGGGGRGGRRSVLQLGVTLFNDLKRMAAKKPMFVRGMFFVIVRYCTVIDLIPEMCKQFQIGAGVHYYNRSIWLDHLVFDHYNPALR